MDVLASIVIIVGVIVVYAVPGMLALFVTENALILNTLFWAPWILAGLMWVFAIELSPEGIRLKRLIGHPRLITWDEFEGVEEAPPGQLVLFGIFLPPLPMREAALALTVRGHYRIRYRGSYCFFPPADAAAFLAAIDRFRRSGAASAK